VVYRGRETVGWASHGKPTTIENVGVNHRCAYIVVTEQLLHGTNVVPILQEVRGERVPQRVAGGTFVNLRLPNGLLHHPLDGALVNVMPIRTTVAAITIVTFGCEHPLPSPFSLSVGVFPRKRRRKANASLTFGDCVVVIPFPTMQMCV